MDSHGIGEGTSSGRLIRYEATGPFNQESIFSLRREIGNFSISHDGEPWAVVAILSGDSLYTPEAESELKILVADMALQGLKVVSYALARHTARILFDVQMKRIYTDSGVKVFLLDDEDVATQAAQDILAQS